MHFISSSLVECLSLLEGSVDLKVERLALDLKQWASMKGHRMPYSGKFCKQRVGLTSLQVMPEAKWSKFDDTRCYMAFLEWWLLQREHQVQGHPLFSRILAALQAGNRLFHILYESGLWMTPVEALEAAKMGKIFVRIYVELANIAFQERRLRYPMVVKLHMCDHSFRRLLRLARNEWILNPLSKTTHADEAARFRQYLLFFVCFPFLIGHVRSGFRGTSGAPFKACIFDDKCIQDPATLSGTSMPSMVEAKFQIQGLCSELRPIQAEEDNLGT